MIAGSLKGEMWLGHRLLGLGTQFDLVGSLVLFSGIVGVGGGNHWDAILRAQGNEFLVNQRLAPDAVTLNLQVEILPENLEQLLERILSSVVLPLLQCMGDDAAQTRRGCDDALMVLLQHCPCHMGLTVEVVERLGSQLQQILIPPEVLGQQD